MFYARKLSEDVSGKKMGHVPTLFAVAWRDQNV
jgi:hypothetical protein